MKGPYGRLARPEGGCIAAVGKRPAAASAVRQRGDGTLPSVGEVVVNATVLVGLLVLYPLILRWAYGLRPEPFDRRQVARQRNCRVFAFIVPGFAIVQLLRLVVEISSLH